MYGKIDTGEIKGRIDRINLSEVAWQIILLLVLPVGILTPIVHTLLFVTGLDFLQPELFYSIWWSGMIWSGLFLTLKKAR